MTPYEKETNVLTKLIALRNEVKDIDTLEDREFVVVTYYHFIRMKMAFEHLETNEQERILRLHETYIEKTI